MTVAAPAAAGHVGAPVGGRVPPTPVVGGTTGVAVVDELDPDRGCDVGELVGELVDVCTIEVAGRLSVVGVSEHVSLLMNGPATRPLAAPGPTNTAWMSTWPQLACGIVSVAVVPPGGTVTIGSVTP